MLTQIYRDLFQLRKTVPIETVLETMFPHLSLIDVTQYTSRIEAIMGINIMEAPTPFNKMAAMNWESLWEELFLSFQQAVTKPFEEQPILREEILNNL